MKLSIRNPINISYFVGTAISIRSIVIINSPEECGVFCFVRFVIEIMSVQAVALSIYRVCSNRTILDISRICIMSGNDRDHNMDIFCLPSALFLTGISVSASCFERCM